MAVNKYQDLHPFMLPELPGCTPAMILQALQRANRQFCMDTEAWVEDRTLDIVADQTEYTLNPTWDADIRRVKELRLNNAENIAAGNMGHVQAPEFYQFQPPNTLVLEDEIKPSESVTKGLEIEVIIIPSLNATSIDPGFVEQWVDAIMGWAMHNLMTMERKKWSNPNRAQFYWLQYMKGWTRAKSEKTRKHTKRSTDLTA